LNFSITQYRRISSKPKHRALLIVEHDPMTLLDRFAKILAAPPVKKLIRR